MSYLNVIALIPTIIEIIKQIEAALPMSGAGKEKLNAVLDIITALDSTFGSLVPQLTAVINVLVKLFNSTGVFTKAPSQT